MAIGNDHESLSNSESSVQATATLLTHRKRVQGCEQKNGCRSTDALLTLIGTFMSLIAFLRQCDVYEDPELSKSISIWFMDLKTLTANFSV